MVVRKTRLLRVLVDIGASVDILFRNVVKNLQLKEEDLKPNHATIKGFGQTKIPIVGRIIVPIILGKGIQATTFQVEFIVI